MTKIWVEKGGQQKQITEYAYELMGFEKSGWVKVSEVPLPLPSQAVMDEPDSGQKKDLSNQSVENLAKKTTDQEVSNEAATGSENSNSEKPDKEGFKKIASDLKPAQMKDFLDMSAVKYHPASKSPVLIDILGKHLNWNVESLKQNFSL